jgi:Kef-type K+ transport system membrane component KefB
MNLLALLLFAAAVGHGASRALKLPAIPLLIGAGMALNVFGLLPAGFTLMEGAEGAQGVAMQALEFGLVFLVFSSGVELNPRRFARHGRTVAWVGLIQFTVSAAIGFFTAYWVGTKLNRPTSASDSPPARPWWSFANCNCAMPCLSPLAEQ